MANHRAIDGSYLGSDPGSHSVHCMRDIQACIDGGYAVLQKVSNGDYAYDVKYVLDAAGNSMLSDILDTTSTAYDFVVTVTGVDNGDGTLSVSSIDEASVSDLPTDTAAPSMDFTQTPTAIVTNIPTALIDLDEVSYTGYVVDLYCWNMANHRAIDGSYLGSDPGSHSVHCMRDIQACIDGGYAVLQKVSNGDYAYDVKYVLDAAGNSMLSDILDTTSTAYDFVVTVTGVDNGDGTLSVSSIEESSGSKNGAYSMKTTHWLYVLIWTTAALVVLVAP